MSLELVLDAGLVIWSFSLAWWLTGRFAQPGSRWAVLDRPNERSLHTTPTPRGGGVAVVLAAAAAVLVMTCRLQLGIDNLWAILAVAGIFAVSYLDDRHTLPTSLRFVVHGLAAAAIVYGGLGLSSLAAPGLDLALSSLLLGALSWLYVVWMINLYNFMDGMDGFCGGMSVAGFGGLALLAALQNVWPLSLFCLLVVAAAGGFLVHNFPPAKIFMGDSGSSTLGCLAAVVSLWADLHAGIPLWLSLLVFSPFVADATVTLIRRLWLRERFWEAHRTHYYQKLVQAGWSHRRTVLAEYLVMAACVASAVWALHAEVLQQRLMLAGWGLFYLLVFAAIHRYEQRHSRRSAA